MVGIDLSIDVTLNNPPRELFTVIDLATVQVKRSTATIIDCEIGYTDGRNGSTGTMRVKLINEGGAWKLDDSTWAGSIA